MSKLTREEKDTLIAAGIFSERSDKPCGDCGGFHFRACPRVKSQQWLGNGNRVGVEYWEPGKWEDGVIFAEDAYETDEGDE